MWKGNGLTTQTPPIEHDVQPLPSFSHHNAFALRPIVITSSHLLIFRTRFPAGFPTRICALLNTSHPSYVPNHK